MTTPPATPTHTAPGRRPFRHALAAAILGTALLGAAPAALGQGMSYSTFKTALPMIQRSVLRAEVDGRMAKIAVDPKSGRMYFAALRTGTIEVLSPDGMSTAQTVADLNEPTGLCILEDQRTLACTCGDGMLRLFSMDDKGELKPGKSVQLEGEADPVRYDPKAKLLWVGHGRFVSSVDPAKGERVKKIELPAAPEGMVVEPGSNRLLVNVATKGQIAVIDRDAGTVKETWTLKDGATGNFPMDLDAKSGRLFVATRNPGKMIVLDAKDGSEVQRLTIADDCDELIFDAVGERVYAVCGGDGGKIVMLWQPKHDGTWAVEHLVDTMAGCRTGVLVPSLRRLVAVAPKLGGYPTFVYIFVLPNAQEHIDPKDVKAPG
jgi:hypothetical protein